MAIEDVKGHMVTPEGGAEDGALLESPQPVRKERRFFAEGRRPDPAVCHGDVQMHRGKTAVDVLAELDPEAFQREYQALMND